MTYGGALLESVIQEIYETAVGGGSWVTCWASLAGGLDSGSPSLYCIDPTTHEGSFAISVGMDEKPLPAYREHYHEEITWVQGATARTVS